MHRMPWQKQAVCSICVLALLYGAVAQAMIPFTTETDWTGTTAIPHPFRSETVTKTYVYDANGNHVATNATVGGERKRYDILGRLVWYEGPEGIEEYTYFGAGPQRRTITRTPANGGDPETVHLLYDGHDVVAAYGSDGLASLFVTPYLDENLSMTLLSGPEAGIYYYTHDGLGSVTGLTDAMGGVRNEYQYTAFGVPYESRVAVPQPYGYTGREYNPLSKDWHYRYRNYNATDGRFNRPDPLGYLSDINLYNYVSNKPYKYVDPFGLKLTICGSRDYRLTAR